MQSKKRIGIVVMIIGAALLFFSSYISGQVGEGKERISSAQGTVDTSNKIFSMNPVTKQVGSTFTGSAQNKIDAGKGQVAQYEQIAFFLQVGGIGALIIGLAMIFLGRKKAD